MFTVALFVYGEIQETSGNDSVNQEVVEPARTSKTPVDEYTPDMAAQAFDLVNEYRIENGLQKLTRTYELDNLAKQHCEYMVSVGDLNHDGFDGRFDSTNYMTFGENVAWNYRIARALVDGWIKSPGHRANILDPSFSFAGMAIVNGYACQEFAGY